MSLSAEHTRAVRARSRPFTRNNREGKLGKPLAVIEITDSEDSDSEEGPTPPRAAVAGPSGSRVDKDTQERANLSHFQQRTHLNENVAFPEPRHNKKSPIRALFLDSDEENEPPVQQANTSVVDLDEMETFREVVDLASLPDSPALPLPPNEDESKPVDDPSILLVQVLEIVPDVQPDHATALIMSHLPDNKPNIVELVLHHLFENPNYPKVDRKGKRKATMQTNEEQAKKPRFVDYASVEREFKGGVHYVELSIEQLMLDYPEIPKPHIRKTLTANQSFYAPTFFFLEKERNNGHPLPYVPKKSRARRTGKTKGLGVADPEFDLEHEWLVQKLREPQGLGEHVDKQVEETLEFDESGDGIECGCCFSFYAFDKMVQCQDGHLFCIECMTSYAENLLGSHNVGVVCMDQSGCKMPFPESELRRFLSDKLMDLYERVKQQKEIEMAGLEGLEECPYCEYKCVMENPDEKLFRCGNMEDCGAITCRKCKKPDHLPKSCQEMEDDKKLDGQHVVEEAMTRALMRSCPRCNKAFIKDDGCNKMTCPNCRSLSCYVCRKLIPEGYVHFNQAPPGAATTSAQSKKCPLWDGPVEARHAKEVQEAAKKATEQVLQDNPDIEAKEIHVDVPKTPPPVKRPALPAAVANPHAAFQNMHQHLQAMHQRLQGWAGGAIPQGHAHAHAHLGVHHLAPIMHQQLHLPIPRPAAPAPEPRGRRRRARR